MFGSVSGKKCPKSKFKILNVKLMTSQEVFDIENSLVSPTGVET